MNTPLRSALRDTFLPILLLVTTLLVPDSARAIQLRWSTGSTDLAVAENTRAVLLVQADSGEVALPNSWQLQWTSDSLDIQFAAFDPNSACLVDTAKVDSIAPPSTPADSAANQITAWFCSSGSGNAASAYFLVDLPAGGHGKMKVVALDPNDSTQVIESNEATYNGGVDGEYAPLILSASSARVGRTLVVTAVGSGLAGVRTADIGARDHAWDVPLAIDASSDSMLVASAEIPVNIPSSVLSLGGSEGVTSTMLPANTSLEPQGVLWTPSGMQEAFTQQEKDSLMSRVPPDGRIQPKDFAFLYAGGKFHLFYIRLNMWDPLYRATRSADHTEKNLGHAVSTDLNHWTWGDATRDTTVLQVRPDKWDNFHVWAPTIVQTDTGFTMFYTGVHQSGARQDQQIGRATSPDLFNWTRYDTPILTAFEVPWAKKGTVTGSGQQLRDPFVMPDPANVGGWLMYFVAVDSSTQASMAVGVARSFGDLTQWTADQNPLRSADSTHLAARRVESPHAFSHGDHWWLFFTPVDPAGGASNLLPAAPVTFEMGTGTDPADSIASHWTIPDTLFNYQNQDPYLGYFHASEHLVVGPHEYLAAYDDWNMRIAITELNWYGPHDFVLGSASTAYLGVPETPGGMPAGLAFAVLGAQPVRSRLAMKLRLPAAMHTQIAIYDVAGRRVRVVLDRDLPAGESGATWDGRNSAGSAVGSGVYFARLSSAAGTRLVRAVLLR